LLQNIATRTGFLFEEAAILCSAIRNIAVSSSAPYSRTSSDFDFP